MPYNDINYENVGNEKEIYIKEEFINCTSFELDYLNNYLVMEQNK